MLYLRDDLRVAGLLQVGPEIAGAIIEDWRIDYNTVRPHSASATGRQRRRPSGTSASICPALWGGSRQIDAFAKLLGVQTSRWS